MIGCFSFFLLYLYLFICRGMLSMIISWLRTSSEFYDFSNSCVFAILYLFFYRLHQPSIRSSQAACDLVFDYLKESSAENVSISKLFSVSIFSFYFFVPLTYSHCRIEWKFVVIMQISIGIFVYFLSTLRESIWKEHNLHIQNYTPVTFSIDSLWMFFFWLVWKRKYF